MTDQYDWSKLDAGWFVRELGQNTGIEREGCAYRYWAEYGAVTNTTLPPVSDPEAAYQFHTAAREQVAKCRVPDWEARCGELQREREFLVAQRDELQRKLELAENNYACASTERDELTKQVRGSVHDSRDWQKLTEENEQLRAKLSAPDVDTGIWVCARLREDIWHSEKRCSYDDAVEWLKPMHAAVATIFPLNAWNALVRSGRAR
jgi:hypothetical protein